MSDYLKFMMTRIGRYAATAAIAAASIGYLNLMPACRAGNQFAGYKPRHGDIVFQSLSHSPLTDMIEGITNSSYSHCGIVEEARGGWKVIEAIGPVRETSLEEWIHQGRNGQFAAYRLKPSYADDINKFVSAAHDYLGRPYDFRYEMDDSKIYCSELVFKAFRKSTHQDLGHLVKLQDLNWQPYTNLIKQLEEGPVPLDREIITPLNLAKAEQLQCVYHCSQDSNGNPLLSDR
jgi:hypothetical protein